VNQSADDGWDRERGHDECECHSSLDDLARRTMRLTRSGRKSGAGG
jgi:hypothetical protein